MNEHKEFYKIYIDDEVVASDMPLQLALIFIKAIYGEFYNEPNLKVTIKRYSNETTMEEVRE